jgi:hypothetical protein
MFIFAALKSNVGHGDVWDTPLSIGPLIKSTPPVGDGELLKKAEGEESWLVTIADRGDASRDPLVVRPCIDCVIECCYRGQQM